MVEVISQTIGGVLEFGKNGEEKCGKQKKAEKNAKA